MDVDVKNTAEKAAAKALEAAKKAAEESETLPDPIAVPEPEGSVTADIARVFMDTGENLAFLPYTVANIVSETTTGTKVVPDWFLNQVRKDSVNVVANPLRSLGFDKAADKLYSSILTEEGKIKPTETTTGAVAEFVPYVIGGSKVYKELGFENVICRYIHERIISIPYISSKFNELKENVLKVQSIWEENWSIGKKWIGYPIDETGTHECNRWSRYGCGYGEGGALSIYCKQLDINSEKIVPISTLL